MAATATAIPAGNRSADTLTPIIDSNTTEATRRVEISVTVMMPPAILSSNAPCFFRYWIVFWMTEFVNHRIHSITTSSPSRGNRNDAFVLIDRIIIPVPSSSGASIGSDTCDASSEPVGWRGGGD